MAGGDVRFLRAVLQPRAGDGNDLFTLARPLDYQQLADGAGFVMIRTLSTVPVLLVLYYGECGKMSGI